MSLFSKNKNKNGGQLNLEAEDNSQKVAVRTMQQDLAAAKKSGEAMNSVIIESIDRYRQGSARSGSIAKPGKTPPPAPRELSRLVETEHKREDEIRNGSNDFEPDLSSISIKDSNFRQASPVFSQSAFKQTLNSAPAAPAPALRPENPSSLQKGLPVSEKMDDKIKKTAPLVSKNFSTSFKIPESLPEELLKRPNEEEPVYLPDEDTKDIEENFPNKTEEKIKEGIKKINNIPETSRSLKPENIGSKESKEPVKKDDKKTAMISQTPPPIQTSPESKPIFANIKKMLAISGVSLILIIAIASGGYFLINRNKNKPSEKDNLFEEPGWLEPIENPVITENQFKIFDFDNTYNIDVDFGTFNQSGGSARMIISEKISSGELEISSSGFTDIQFSINGEFSASSQIVEAAAKGFPESVISAAGEKYNLIAYMQGSSPRLGLILEVSDKGSLISLMRGREDILSDSLSGLYLNSDDFGKAASEKFSETAYKDAAVRYKNFPVHFSAIDYAVLDNLLLITTSKDSMFSLADFVSQKISGEENNVSN